MSNIETLLRERLAGLEPLRLEVIDDSAEHAGHAGAKEGGHYRLLIVSRHFAEKSTLQRHRLIHDALGNLKACRIHALSIRSLTPDEVA